MRKTNIHKYINKAIAIHDEINKYITNDTHSKQKLKN